jgi:hypothetical protein
VKLTVADVVPGKVFRTQAGIWAVKSEYHYPNGNCKCVLLGSGEYAHFPLGDAEPVAMVIDVVGIYGANT